MKAYGDSCEFCCPCSYLGTFSIHSKSTLPLLPSHQGDKTRHELLNDMIARSKERKLEKARGKEEQESERERLDEGMTELMAMLSQRPSKGDRRIGESDDYDQTMRVRESYFKFIWAVMGTS